MIGRTVAALLLWLALPAAWAAERIHGADAHFASADVALEWAVLRHPDEERTEVVIRVVDRSGRLVHYTPVPLPGPRLPHDIAITAAEEARPRFHAIGSRGSWKSAVR